MSQPQDDQQNQQMQQQTQQQQNQQLIQQQSKHEQDALQQQQVQQVQQQVQQQVPSQQQLPPSSLAHGLGPPAPSATLVETSSASITLPPSSNSHIDVSQHSQPTPAPSTESTPLPPSSNLTPLPSLPSDLDSARSSPTPKEKPTQLTAQGPLPKSTALVKPQTLTHAIEGFVIQESDQPFPINRAACFGDLMDHEESGELLSKKIHFSDGTQDPTPSPVSDDKESSKGAMATSTPSSGVPNPIKWFVTELCDFIRNLPGCAKYVEDFAMQEIDGEALMLLECNHLMETMSMKLGPALKIMAKIDSMRQAAEEAAVPPAKIYIFFIYYYLILIIGEKVTVVWARGEERRKLCRVESE